MRGTAPVGLRSGMCSVPVEALARSAAALHGDLDNVGRDRAVDPPVVPHARGPACDAGTSRFSASRYRVFGRLHRLGSDDLAGRLRLKDGWLFCEWIHAALVAGFFMTTNLASPGITKAPVFLSPGGQFRPPPR